VLFLYGNLVILGLFLRDQSFGLERGHATCIARRVSLSVRTCDPATLTRTRAGDGLSILFILDVTCGKHSLDAGLGGARYGDDVTVGVGVYLFPNEGGSGFVTDGVKETVDIQRRGLARLDILDGEGLKQITVTLALGRDRLDAGQTVISDHVPSALVGRRGSHSKARSPWDDLSTAWP